VSRLDGKPNKIGLATSFPQSRRSVKVHVSGLWVSSLWQTVHIMETAAGAESTRQILRSSLDYDRITVFSLAAFARSEGN